MSVVAPTMLDFERIVLNFYFLFLWFHYNNKIQKLIQHRQQIADMVPLSA